MILLLSDIVLMDIKYFSKPPKILDFGVEAWILFYFLRLLNVVIL